MPRRHATFKQADMTRAIKAAKASGMPVRGVEVDREGRIVVLLGEPKVDPSKPDNPWDVVLQR